MKTFQELRDHIHECKYSEMEAMCDGAEQMSQFQLGQFSGSVMTYNEIDRILRNAIKYENVE